MQRRRSHAVRWIGSPGVSGHLVSRAVPRMPRVRQVVETRSTRTPNRSQRSRRCAVVVGGGSSDRTARARRTSAAAAVPSSRAWAWPATTVANSVREVGDGSRTRVAAATRTASSGSDVRESRPARRTPSSHASRHGASASRLRASSSGASRSAVRCARSAGRSTTGVPVAASTTATRPPTPDRSSSHVSRVARSIVSRSFVTGQPDQRRRRVPLRPRQPGEHDPALGAATPGLQPFAQDRPDPGKRWILHPAHEPTARSRWPSQVWRYCAMPRSFGSRSAS